MVQSLPDMPSLNELPSLPSMPAMSDLPTVADLPSSVDQAHLTAPMVMPESPTPETTKTDENAKNLPPAGKDLPQQPLPAAAIAAALIEAMPAAEGSGWPR
jgi:hypothetical protein